jgi:RimJ/RimL family protein N-acetyltransferase
LIVIGDSPLKFASNILGVDFLSENGKAIGIAGKNGDIKAAVVYTHIIGDDTNTYNDCMMHIAAKPKTLWARDYFLRAIFEYPFIQLGCSRVTTNVLELNTRALRLNERVGFQFEGIKRSAYNGVNIIMMGMLKSECKYIDHK